MFQEGELYVQFVEDSIEYWLNSADHFQPEMAVYDVAVCLHEQLLFVCHQLFPY